MSIYLLTVVPIGARTENDIKWEATLCMVDFKETVNEGDMVTLNNQLCKVVSRMYCPNKNCSEVQFIKKAMNITGEIQVPSEIWQRNDVEVQECLD